MFDPRVGIIKTQIAQRVKEPYNTFAALGDSITVQESGYQSYNDGWFALAVCRSKKGKIVTNAGIGGNTTAQMLARVDTDIIAFKPSVCFVMGGANDVMNGVSPETTASTLEQIYLKLMTAGILPVTMSITPRRQDDGYNYAAVSEKANFLIQKIAKKYKLPYIDVRTPLVDPETGMLKASLAKDLIHPNAAGSRVMATAVETQFLNFLPDYGTPLPCSNVSTWNMLTNPLFITDANSDGKPDGWTIVGTAVVSLSASDDGIGNWCTVQNTDSSILNINQWFPISGGKYAAGDILRLTGEMKSANVQSGSGKYGIAFQFVGSNPEFIYPIYNWTTDLSNPVRFCIEVTVPAGSSGLATYFTMNEGTGSVSFRRLELLNLTKSGLL